MISPSPTRKLLRLPALREKLGSINTPVGATTIYRWMKEANFPRPIKLGRRVALWDEGEVNAWIEQRAGFRERESTASLTGGKSR